MAAKVSIPAVTRGRTMLVRSSDWERHKHELLVDVLPKFDRLVVCLNGDPLFAVRQVADFERVSFKNTAPDPEARWTRPQAFNMRHYVRGSEFRHHRAAILSWARKTHEMVVVTWYGWPDYVVSGDVVHDRIAEFEAIHTRQSLQKRFEDRAGGGS